MFKMLISAFLFLIAIGGVLSERTIEECREEEDTCDSSGLPGDFPKTAELMDALCVKGIAYLKCQSDVMDKCGNEDDEAEFMASLILYLQSQVCNPESHIYEAISTNLECIETAMENYPEPCSPRFGDDEQKKVLDALEDYLLEKLDINEHFSLEHGKNCMDILFNVACKAMVLDRDCGTPVGDAFLDIGKNVHHNIKLCPENVVNELPHIVNTLRSITKVEDGAVSEGKGTDCREEADKKCDSSGLPKGFPKTKELMDTLCVNGIAYLKCQSDVLNECGRDNDEAEFLTGVIFYLQRRLCNPESHIYEVISGNIECIESSVDKIHDGCPSRSENDERKKVIDALEDYLLEKLDINEHFSLEHGRDCMYLLMDMACRAVTLGQECGTPVADAFLDIVNNLDDFIQKCPENVVNELPHIVNTIRSITKVGEEVENAIKKRK